jgi:hypothetical protein
MSAHSKPPRAAFTPGAAPPQGPGAGGQDGPGQAAPAAPWGEPAGPAGCARVVRFPVEEVGGTFPLTIPAGAEFIMLAAPEGRPAIWLRVPAESTEAIQAEMTICRDCDWHPAASAYLGSMYWRRAMWHAFFNYCVGEDEDDG